jgi:hypothetical protein
LAWKYSSDFALPNAKKWFVSKTCRHLGLLPSTRSVLKRARDSAAFPCATAALGKIRIDGAGKGV